MDYSDVNFYPMMANPEYSPVSETFSYPDQFDGFSDSLSYSNRDAALGEAAFQPTHRSLSRTAPSPIGHAANGWPSFNPTSFGSMGQRCDSFITAELPNGLASQLSPLPSPTCASPEHVLPVPACSSASGSISPRSLEHASPISEASYHQSEAEHLAKPAPRKRGRPRLNRNPGTDGSSTSNGVRRSTCLPHKQVERKYREGLNMEFERLRRTVPTLPQSVEANIMGAAKPSKGMVLAAAIDYIKRIERELDAAVDEIERLGGNVRVGKLENRMGPIRTA